jgi:hypothetical protein
MCSIFLAVTHKLFLLGENKGPEASGRKTLKSRLGRVVLHKHIVHIFNQNCINYSKFVTAAALDMQLASYRDERNKCMCWL